jgi:hypothetical protein
MKTNVGCFITPKRHNISNQPNFGKTSNKNISTCNHAKEHYKYQESHFKHNSTLLLSQKTKIHTQKSKLFLPLPYLPKEIAEFTNSELSNGLMVIIGKIEHDFTYVPIDYH